MVKENPTVKPPGLTNDFSEQEQTMTASAMPPKFALTAASATSEVPAAAGRKLVPFGGFGGDLEFDDERTTTVLGRCIEGSCLDETLENVDQPLGTNYFRYQPEFMVGKNKGGGNVLDVADRTWSWPLNNAWLQAAVHRGDRIRFISDPKDPATLYKKGGTPANKLTITGQELGVLMNMGYAPNEGNGVVQKGYRPADHHLEKEWEKIGREVKNKKLFQDIDAVAYKEFLEAAQAPARAPKEVRNPSGEIVAVQTNFFGGKVSPKDGK